MTNYKLIKAIAVMAFINCFTLQILYNLITVTIKEMILSGALDVT